MIFLMPLAQVPVDFFERRRSGIFQIIREILTIPESSKIKISRSDKRGGVPGLSSFRPDPLFASSEFCLWKNSAGRSTEEPLPYRLMLVACAFLLLSLQLIPIPTISELRVCAASHVRRAPLSPPLPRTPPSSAARKVKRGKLRKKR